MVVWCVTWSNLVSAPVPFGFRSYWDLVGFGDRAGQYAQICPIGTWLGLGLGGFGTKGGFGDGD